MDSIDSILSPSSREGQRCSVLFSGGSDSTLVAAYALERFEEVDLVTYDRRLLFFLKNTRKHAEKLAEKYGPTRVRHVFFNVNDIFDRIFVGELDRDLPRYGTHLSLLVCLGCKMAMHAQTILYNLQNGIAHTFDGARRETDWYPAQMASVKEQMRLLYADFGLVLDSPVYEMVRTDEMIHEMGIADARTLKSEFLLYETQPSCIFGSVAHIYTRLFYGPFFGYKTREQDALEYFQQKRPIVEEYVRESLASTPAEDVADAGAGLLQSEEGTPEMAPTAAAGCPGAEPLE